MPTSLLKEESTPFVRTHRGGILLKSGGMPLKNSGLSGGMLLKNHNPHARRSHFGWSFKGV